MRPCDRASATILAFQDELTALGLLRDDERPPPAARPGRKATQPHGTYAGYQRHRRAGELPCAHCAEASRERRRALTEARRAS